MFQFINQQTDLEHVLNLMQHTSTYGLDTEFIKVDTLWPKLGVFQINVNGQVFLLDGTTLNLDRFWFQLFQAQQNIFHACGEDIDLIYHYADQKNPPIQLLDYDHPAFTSIKTFIADLLTHKE